MLEKFPFKKVDPKVTEHPIEKRGFVQVPFDYENPNSEKVDIFYRFIPAYDSTPSDRTKPIIVIFNGGPGIPSSSYRPLNYNYENLDAPENGPVDRGRYLRKSFHLILADQRGTDGQSIPLDMDNPTINANAIAKYFSSDYQARDYAAIIKEVIPETVPFFIIAQSYGGMVGMQYLGLKDARKPKGIIFSCSALPHETTEDAMLARRQEQLDLNLQLKAAFPDIEARLFKVRNHFKSQQIDPDQINGLFAFLGKGDKGAWEKKLIAHLDLLLTQNTEEIKKSMKDNHGDISLLNYILSSSNFTPGETDRTQAMITSQKIPYEPWMLDENWIAMLAGNNGTWRDGFVQAIDKAPPPPTPVPSVDDLRKAIAQNQLLFTPAENDAFVPADQYERSFRKYLVDGHTQVKLLPGGHSAIFLEKGHDAILEWGKSIQSF